MALTAGDVNWRLGDAFWPRQSVREFQSVIVFGEKRIFIDISTAGWRFLRTIHTRISGVKDALLCVVLLCCDGVSTQNDVTEHDSYAHTHHMHAETSRQFWTRKAGPKKLLLVLVTPPPVGGRGIVFWRFLSLFLRQQHYEKTAGPICTKFSGKVWSDHGTTWLHFGSIRVNGSAGQRSICLLSPAIAQRTGVNKSVSFARWQQGAGFVVPRTTACCYQFSKGPKIPKAFFTRSAAQRNFAYTFVLTMSTDLPSQIFHLFSN